MKDWQYQVMAAAFSEKYEGNQGIRLSETPVTWLAGEGAKESGRRRRLGVPEQRTETVVLFIFSRCYPRTQ